MARSLHHRPSPLPSLLLLLPLLSPLAAATTSLRGMSGVGGVSVAQHLQQQQKALWEQHRGLEAAAAAAVGVKLSFKPAAAANTGAYSLVPPSQIAPVCDVAGPVNLTLSNSRLSPRTWKGWGTSLAWFTNYLGQVPAADQKTVLDLLFSKTTGLGLNIVRYNIGGDYSRANSPQFLVDTPIKYRAMEGFKSGPKAAYNWSADASQRAVLLGAKARGANTFVAFANSPPWWMTISGDVAGGVKGASNLQPKYYQGFADYLTDVVQQYKTRWGVDFQFVEPVNEPEKAWKKGGPQEGCAFSQQEFAALIPVVAATMARKNVTASLVGMDGLPTASATYFFLSPASVTTKLSMFHVHGYESTLHTSGFRYPAMEYSRAAAVASQFGKELWLSEWGPDQATGDDMGLALYMSRIIVQAVNIMRASAFSYWQPVDSTPEWALVHMSWDPKKPSNITINKKFVALQQFTQLVPKGSVPITLQSPLVCFYCTAAFYDPCNKRLSVFVVNQQPTDRPITVNVQGFKKAVGGVATDFTLYRTSATENIAVVPNPNKALSLPLQFVAKAQSLSTLVISNVNSRKTIHNVCKA